MNIVLCILLGFLLGFPPGCGNTAGSMKMALFTGLLFGAFLGGVDLLFGVGLLPAAAICGGAVGGSIAAARTPNDNPIKRYFNLSSRRG